MIPDAEIISLVCTILSRLDVGTFTIKVSVDLCFSSWQCEAELSGSSTTVKFWMASSKSAASQPTRFAQYPPLWISWTRCDMIS